MLLKYCFLLFYMLLFMFCDCSIFGLVKWDCECKIKIKKSGIASVCVFSSCLDFVLGWGNLGDLVYYVVSKLFLADLFFVVLVS